MYIKELTNEEYKNFTDIYNLKSIYQTVEYGLIMNKQNYETIFLGLMNDSEVIAASLILIEKKDKFKYAYAPRGFLIDYNNYALLETFTKEIKKYLKKLNIIAIKLCPMIIKNIYDKKTKLTIPNEEYENTFSNLKKLGYYHFGYNYYFEALKPRTEAIIDLNLPYYLLFKNIKKEFRTKIRSAENKGVKVYKGNVKNLEYLYIQTKKKYPRNLEYFKDCYKYFNKSKNIDFFYTKLDTALYLKNINENYQNQEKICNEINKKLKDNQNIINQKLKEDKLLENYRKELIKATNYLKEAPDGIITSSVLIAKNKDECFMLMDGYNPKYKSFNSKHLLIWKLIEKYSKEGYKKFNLGGIADANNPDKYKGLNNFKLDFNAKAIEYIGDLELITNKTLYFLYKNSFSLKKILKK